MISDNYLNLKTCDTCGKKFKPASYHIYKIGMQGGKCKCYCTYSCYKKAGGDSGKLTSKAINEPYL